MENKKIFGIVSLAVATLMIGSLVSAANYSSEQSEKIQKAIEDNDYEEWKNLIIETLTEENFDKLVESQRNQEEFNSLTKKLIDAWENGDKDRIEEIEEALRELSREIYGDDVEFMASDGGLAIGIADGGDRDYVSNIPNGMNVKSTYGVVSTFASSPCKVGEKCETESIKIAIGPTDGAENPSNEMAGVVVVKDESDDSSFWKAFRFW